MILFLGVGLLHSVKTRGPSKVSTRVTLIYLYMTGNDLRAESLVGWGDDGSLRGSTAGAQ